MNNKLKEFSSYYGGGISFFAFFARLVFLAVLMSSLGAFELFKLGGAVPQGLDNVVETQGLLKYVNHILIVLISLFFIFYFLLKKFKIQRSFFTHPAWLVIVLLLCSVVWHQVNGTEYVLGVVRVTVLLVFVMLFFMLTPYVVPFVILLRDMNFLFLCCSFLSVFLAVFVPSYGVDFEGRGWQGMFNHKNQLGAFCVLVSCISLISFSAYPVLSKFNLVLALFLVWMSGSYTSFAVVSILVVSCFLPGFVKRYVLKIRFLIFFILLGLNLSVVAFSVVGSYLDFDILGKDMSFSGRDKIWIYVVERMEGIFSGYGINSIALQNELDPEPFRQATGQLLGSAHNGVMNLYYDFGVPGCVVVFLLYIFYLLGLGDVNNKDNFSFFVFIMAALLLNIFESKLVGFNAFFVLFVFVYCYFSKRKISE